MAASHRASSDGSSGGYEDAANRHIRRNKAHFGSESDAISGLGLRNRGRIYVTNSAKRGEFVSQDPKYLLDDTSSYRQAINSLQQMLKGMQSGSFNNVYNKQSSVQRWKRGFRKGYLDYTNSQMPFNEGTKRSPKGKKDAAYSRVRRFLEEERRLKGCTTLEAKEAAMSRVLDPNLNLDCILEPHVRKRRRPGLRENASPDYM